VNVVGLEAGPVGFDEEAADFVVFVSTLAQMTATSAIVPDVITSSRHSARFFPDLRARVLHPAGWNRSRVPSIEAAKLIALLHGWQQVFFCSSLQRCKSDTSRAPDCTLTNERTPESPARVPASSGRTRRCPSQRSRSLQGRAKKPSSAIGLDQFAWEASCPIAFLDDRDEIVLDELARRIANQAFLVAEEGVEIDKIYALY